MGKSIAKKSGKRSTKPTRSSNGARKTGIPLRPLESRVAPWRYLVRRRHAWRKQLYIKGRNMTARQLVGSIKSNQMNDQMAAENYRLPVAAVREALTYVEQNSQLLEIEAEIERLMANREGTARVAPTVP